jgi:hypothetical protein
MKDLRFSWRRYVPPKRRLKLDGLHGVISEKMIFFKAYENYFPFEDDPRTASCMFRIQVTNVTNAIDHDIVLKLLSDLTLK